MSNETDGPTRRETSEPHHGVEPTATPERDAAKRGDPGMRHRPKTLVELYTLPKAQVSDLLTGLARRNEWTTSHDDQENALRLLPSEDAALAKTRTLAHHVATGHDGRFAASFEPFLVQSVEADMADVPGWPPSAGADGPELFRRMLDLHAAALAASSPPRRLFNAIMIAQAVLVARYRLDIPDAVPVLSRAIGSPSALRAQRRNTRLTRLRALGDPRLTVDALRTWLDLLSPWIERATEAERETSVQLAALKHAEAGLRDRDARIGALERDLDAARAEIAALRQDLQAKAERERGVTLARQHEGSQLRGSMAGVLADDVMGLLTAVREGLELDPPRAAYSLERLEDVEHAIEGKVRWLRSSD